MPDSISPSNVPSSVFTTGGITVAPTQPAEAFGMAESDWDRLYRHVHRIRQRRRWPENLMWACIAILAGAVFALIGWFITYSTLTIQDRDGVVWEGWVLLVVAVSAGIAAAVCAAFLWSSTNEFARDKQDILEDMREIHPPRSEAPAFGVQPLARRHYPIEVVGRFVRCSCGQSVTSGPAWDAHLKGTL
jgi:hypothetical protein